MAGTSQLLVRYLRPRRDTRIPKATHGGTLNRQRSWREKLSGGAENRRGLPLALPGTTPPLAPSLATAFGGFRSRRRRWRSLSFATISALPRHYEMKLWPSVRQNGQAQQCFVQDSFSAFARYTETLSHPYVRAPLLENHSTSADLHTIAAGRNVPCRNGVIASTVASGNSSCTDSLPLGNRILRMPGNAARASISARDLGGVSLP